MYYILSKLFCEKKKLFGYSAMSVLLIPEAVQILVKNKFEITDEEVSLLHVECVLSRIALNDGMVQVRCALFPVKLRKRPLGLALHVSIFFLQLSHQSFSGLFNTPCIPPAFGKGRQACEHPWRPFPKTY